MSRERLRDAIFVAAATCIGAWLRLRQLGVPCFWLDEIIHYDGATGATRQSLWQWLAITQIENGPLFYATQLAGRLVLPTEASARIAPAICGIAAIPLIWFAARALTVGRGTPYAATLLLAIAPLHVYYSREGRPYAMSVLIGIALLALVLRGASMRAIVLLLVAAFYSTAIIAPFIFSIAVAAVLTRQRRLAIAATICLVLMALCYQPAVQPAAQGKFPSVNALLNAFAVTGLDAAGRRWPAYVFALLAVIGAVVLARRNARHAIIVITVAVLPTLIPVIAAWRMRPYFVVRYVITALPAYLILVAIGADEVFSPIRQPRLRGIVAAALLCVPAWTASLNEPFRKLDWRTVARAVALHVQPGDRIIAAHHWAAYCLSFYLRDVAPQLAVVDAKGFPQPETVAPAWIVVAQDPNGTFTPWACRFPTLLASPIENFHLHYAGPPRRFPRLDEDTGAYLDEISVWRARGGRELPKNFDRNKLSGLLGRLGFNPARAIPALMSRRVALANLVATVADNSICDDDATFLRKLSAATAIPAADLAAQLRLGTSRSAVAWRAGDSDKLRAQLR